MKKSVNECELSKKKVLEKAKEFNGSIKNIKEFFEHVKQLEECSNCNRVFWDRLCPDCVNKITKREEKRIQKKILKTIKKMKLHNVSDENRNYNRILKEIIKEIKK